MIINNAPQNEAILSNVGEVGEFRIRNSAKAFSILSSGLYANKIRAIIRELSCNAVDSHVAAGKTNVPFDVHLPTQFEPWFAIRDYGTGLNHDQVTNIYTTYFDSTKTSSNDFIGALGLGSKSPFSYTDNFSITAIKDGRKGIYTAFINDMGVPSIALMMEEETTEANGVEVKFSVNDYYDYDKFKQEARSVYRYFELKPVISDSNFEFQNLDYDVKDIAPGVHSYKNAQNRSIAVMGNIAYPIELPSSESIGPLAELLHCGLEMHFGIGELDFQASREGLSYIPQTINAIKNKLLQVNEKLTERLAEEADKIENIWDRATFLMKKANSSLWNNAVIKYIADTQFPVLVSNGRYVSYKSVKFSVKALARRWNISIRAFNKSSYYTTCTVQHPVTNRKARSTKDRFIWEIRPETGVYFVVQDIKRGALERAKYHWRQKYANEHSLVYVLSPEDADKPMKLDEFYAHLNNPPADRIFNASSLIEKERAKGGNNIGKNVSILRLELKSSHGNWRGNEYVWADAGKADQFDKNRMYYYLPLSGYQVQSTTGKDIDAKLLINYLHRSGVTEFANIEVYGVRKGDIEFIKTQKNWINLEKRIKDVLTNISSKTLMAYVVAKLDRDSHIKYNEKIINTINNVDSPYVKFVSQFKGHEKLDCDQKALNNLIKDYAQGSTVDPNVIVEKFMDERSAVYKRYPLLDNLQYYTDDEKIAEYINMVDTLKGI
jgi:hypothetical protein